VDLPISKMNVEIARQLKENHFVFDYKMLDDGHHGRMRVYLKYHDGKPVIRHLQRVSRPGRRHYVGVEDIPRVRNGLGMAILSTSRGVLSDRAARKERVGGEVLAVVW
jgi:small subunit ribosomal protein S8